MLEIRVNEENTEPRCACVLVLDTSGSMSGQPLEELNRGLQQFAADIKEDALARKRLEVSVVTVASDARIATPFTEAQDFEPPHLQASGATALGQGLRVALDELNKQKQAYKENGLEYYRPWLVIMTDGGPTDETSSVVSALLSLEAKKGVVIMPIAVGEQADLGFLSTLSKVRTPGLMRNVHNFKEFFSWLSKSLGQVSVSASHASGDSGLAETTQVPLPSAQGWMSA